MFCQISSYSIGLASQTIRSVNRFATSDRPIEIVRKDFTNKQFVVTKKFPAFHKFARCFKASRLKALGNAISIKRFDYEI